MCVLIIFFKLFKKTVSKKFYKPYGTYKNQYYNI